MAETKSTDPKTVAAKPATCTDGVGVLVAHLKNSGTPEALLKIITESAGTCTATNVLDGIAHAVRWAEAKLHPVGYAGTLAKARQFMHDQAHAVKPVAK